MKTIVIHIEEHSTAEKGFPVYLYFNDGKSNWNDKSRAQARAKIPRSLSVSEPPLDPRTNQTLKPENLREILLTERQASNRFEAAGEYLYKLLFRDEVKKRWEKLCEKYLKEEKDDEKEGLRTFLAIAPKELSLLPWELMVADRLSLPLFMDPLNPISRGSQKMVSKQICDRWPLHVLIVVGSDENDEAVAANDEICSIEEALLHFDIPAELEVLRRPTWQGLVDTLQSFHPHIFHFIGHGRKAAGPRNVPVLAFEAGASGPAWEWNDKMISVDLRAWRPRLAFINSCRSSTQEEADHTLGITEAFIKAGVPAVIGMQADVRGSAAARFPGEIYKALSGDNALDVALAKARAKVSRIEQDGLQRRDWALATFFLSVDPVKVVHMKPPATSEFRTEINQQFADIKLFVDRVEPRRELWRAVDHAPSDQAKKLLIIRGLSSSGKTWLVYWCLRSCKWRDLNVHYVSLKQKSKITDGAKNFLDVLRAIIAPNRNNQFGQPLPPEAFYRFNALVNYLLSPTTEPNPASISASRRVDDKGFPFKEDLDEDSIHAILGEFKLGLRNAAQKKTWVLALDDLSKAEIRKDHFKNYLLLDLIRPIARGSDENLTNIRMILALKQDEYDEDQLGLTELKNLALNIQLGSLDGNELRSFARDLCILRQIPPAKMNAFFTLLEGSSVTPADVQGILACLNP